MGLRTQPARVFQRDRILPISAELLKGEPGSQRCWQTSDT